MGIFRNETEEEKSLRKLARAIENSYLNYSDRDYLSDYVMSIYNGESVNDFYTIEYLNRVILETIESKNEIGTDLIIFLKKAIATLKLLLPLGTNQTNFERMMEIFINNFLGIGGILTKDLFDSKFYSLFENEYDYLVVMNIICNDEDIIDQFENIKKFALEVSPFCSNNQILKREVISFINGLSSVYGSAEMYHKNMIDAAKKRCGIYPLDEAQLAVITKEAEKAASLILKLEAQEKKINNFQERINTSTKAGKQEINSTVKNAKKKLIASNEETLAKMREMLTESKAMILKELDEYLLQLQDQLKSSSDAVFNKILEDAELKINSIRLAASGLSRTATLELLRIQSTTQESVEKLKDYVENNEKLNELLKGSEENEQIRSMLVKLCAGNEESNNETMNVSGSQNIIIPGYDRVVSPANPSVVVPNGVIPRTILPAFDESIPFDVRIKRILDVKAELQSQGEIFHDMTDEIIRCIMEGDWPYLWGPSGCGKSYTIRQIAKLLGIDLVDNGKITDKYSIMAYNDPQGRFRATQTFVALVYGKMLSLDEFDNGNPDTQVVLNELYSGLLDTLAKPNEHYYVTFAEDMRVPIHPNFRMISAGNTTGEGENQIFSSRGKIDESVQQRMTPKRFWYDNRVEKKIFGNYENWYNFFVNFRTACDDYAVKQGLDSPLGTVTTRDASAIVKYINHNSKSIEQVIDEQFVQIKSNDYLKFFIKRFSNIYGVADQTRVNEKPLSEYGEKELAKVLIKKCSDVCERRHHDN